MFNIMIYIRILWIGQWLCRSPVRVSEYWDLSCSAHRKRLQLL